MQFINIVINCFVLLLNWCDGSSMERLLQAERKLSSTHVAIQPSFLFSYLSRDEKLNYDETKSLKSVDGMLNGSFSMTNNYHYNTFFVYTEMFIKDVYPNNVDWFRQIDDNSVQFKSRKIDDSTMNAQWNYVAIIDPKILTERNDFIFTTSWDLGTVTRSTQFIGNNHNMLQKIKQVEGVNRHIAPRSDLATALAVFLQNPGQHEVCFMNEIKEKYIFGVFDLSKGPIQLDMSEGGVSLHEVHFSLDSLDSIG